ncbi:MAG: hypothetical protein AB1797_13570 [bacterium]
MEIAIGLMGLSLTLLGLILAYIWKSNGHLQREMMNVQREMMTALEHIEESQKGIAQMLLNQTKILEKVEERLSSA